MMDGTNYEAEVIYKLDLGKYGLADLEDRNLLTLSEADMARLLEALGNDDISLDFPIPCTPVNIQKVLSFSHCRMCGRCCNPNPLNPESPGIEAFKDELASIAGYLQVTYESLEAGTSAGKYAPYPFRQTKLEFTRWLPLPCPFHNAEKHSCNVHSMRPLVCKIHPIIFTGDDSCISIKANCDYGKDLIIGACKYVRELDPAAEIIL
jgi:Fe-S-cluster containining protein